MDATEPVVVWTEPIPTAVRYASRGEDEAGLYLALGGAVGLDDRWSVSWKASYLDGNWLGCASRTAGGFGSIGVRRSLRPGSQGEGPFVEARATFRTMKTTGSEPSSGFFSCTSVDGADQTIGATGEIGWQWTFGPVVVSPVFGLTPGLCTGCLTPGPFWFGGMFPDGKRSPARFSLDVDVAIVRVGVAL